MQAADRRRFNGPEGARPLRFTKASSLDRVCPDLHSMNRTESIHADEHLCLTAQTQANDAASSSRQDGRTPSQIRPICEHTYISRETFALKFGLELIQICTHFTVMQTGLVSDAAGSVYIETGRTKVICAVHGPKPTAPSVAFSPKARLNVEVKFAPFSSGVRRFAPGKDTESLTLSSAVHQAILPSLLLETLPKSQIDLFLTILESDGNDDDISAGITAASVALAQAGIPMRGLVVATSAALLARSPTQAFLDPTLAEARKAVGFATIACLPALGTITNIATTGAFPLVVLEEVLQTLETAFKICGQLHGVAKQALLDDSNEEA
ncbi:BQ2448_1438 [Microbotryum intermedium]|uniref:BQ2448_1438 protein n=1 Tax=Microbotryum intermedium TaxID=269621 RepID=A0A238FDT1_9BASI|nr:BQ2448_1438 [Microbotryum intermedium]